MWISYPKIIFARAWPTHVSPSCSASSTLSVLSSILCNRRSVSWRTMKFEVRKTALQNKLTLNNYSSNGKQTAERRCFTVVWSQFWTSSKFLSALETTTNNQEVKRSLYRLQNVDNLPKEYIRVCMTCRSHAELFNFIGLVELQE